MSRGKDHADPAGGRHGPAGRDIVQRAGRIVGDILEHAARHRDALAGGQAADQQRDAAVDAELVENRLGDDDPAIDHRHRYHLPSGVIAHALQAERRIRRRRLDEYIGQAADEGNALAGLASGVPKWPACSSSSAQRIAAARQRRQVERADLLVDTNSDGDGDTVAVQRYAADGSKLGAVTMLQGLSPALVGTGDLVTSFDMEALAAEPLSTVTRKRTCRALRGCQTAAPNLL